MHFPISRSSSANRSIKAEGSERKESVERRSMKEESPEGVNGAARSEN